MVARAQQPGDRVRRIGLLMPDDENDVAKTNVSAFTQALAGLGWTDGRNMRIDLRWFGGDINRARALAAELVGLQPDIILANGSLATIAVQRETRVIPIVFASVVGDPVTIGFVERLNEPGGNITGFALFEPSMGGKWLELLSEIAPGLKRPPQLVLIWHPLCPGMTTPPIRCGTSSACVLLGRGRTSDAVNLWTDMQSSQASIPPAWAGTRATPRCPVCHMRFLVPRRPRMVPAASAPRPGQRDDGKGHRLAGGVLSFSDEAA